MPSLMHTQFGESLNLTNYNHNHNHNHNQTLTLTLTVTPVCKYIYVCPTFHARGAALACFARVLHVGGGAVTASEGWTPRRGHDHHRFAIRAHFAQGREGGEGKAEIGVPNL